MKAKRPTVDEVDVALDKDGINIKALLDHIDFSSDNVVEAATENAPLFRIAIDYRIECLRNRNAAKMSWEVAKADKELRIREDARNNGERVTERNVEAIILVDPAITDLQEKYNRADEIDEYSKLVVEAFRMRRDCLRIIGDLTRTDFSIQKDLETGHEKLENTRKKLRQRFPGDV